jgi:hypothetical protein
VCFDNLYNNNNNNNNNNCFDNVPHSWIIKSLELIGINNVIQYFTKKAVSYWKTSMSLHTERKITETEDLEITLGIRQGDSLSPLLFCISLIPFTEQLNRLNKGCEEQTTKTKYHIYFTWTIGKTGEELKKCK